MSFIIFHLDSIRRNLLSGREFGACPYSSGVNSLRTSGGWSSSSSWSLRRVLLLVSSLIGSVKMHYAGSNGTKYLFRQNLEQHFKQNCQQNFQSNPFRQPTHNSECGVPIFWVSITATMMIDVYPSVMHFPGPRQILALKGGGRPAIRWECRNQSLALTFILTLSLNSRILAPSLSSFLLLILSHHLTSLARLQSPYLSPLT